MCENATHIGKAKNSDFIKNNTFLRNKLNRKLIGNQINNE